MNGHPPVWDILMQDHPHHRLSPAPDIPRCLGHLPVDAEHRSADQQNRRHDQGEVTAMHLVKLQ